MGAFTKYTADVISTHTPHTGCDGFEGAARKTANISTHTPHTGCDIIMYSVCGVEK